MILFNQISTEVKRRFFSSVLSNNLIYNTCWEDPRIDRALLNIGPQSHIVMLTSAGCNALDYLLDFPAHIHCVDQNPRQNALLHLKLALFRYGDFNLLEDLFVRGYHHNPEALYFQELRQHIPPEYHSFWDKKTDYFNYHNSYKTFYFNGTSGKIAWLLRKYFARKGILALIDKLLEAQSLPEQTYYFDQIEEVIWSGFFKWLVKRDTALSFLGVPLSQRKLIDRQFKSGIKGFIQQALRHVFTELPIADNYFWHVYLKGYYSDTCRPNYLRPSHFNTLCRQTASISTHSCSIISFLRKNPGSYSHFVLLDHQDWMVEQNQALLAEEWRLILKNAQKGARILFRSAGLTHHFLPAFVEKHVTFKPELTHPLHQRDRVGTYGSTHLAIVQ